MSIKKVLGIFILGLCTVTSYAANSDTDYPNKPITWIIPDGAGGGLDSIIRTIYPYVEKNLPNNAKFVIKNLPGATQTIAASAVYNAKPDGYTIGQSSVAALTIMTHLGRTSYKSYDEFELIANVFDAAHYLVVPGDSKFKSFDDFMAYAKGHSGELKVGIDGVYNVQHLPLMNLQKKSGTKLNVIIYKSSAETKKALLGHEIDAGILPSHIIVDEYNNGSINPLVDVMEVKPDYLKDIPSLKDKGFTPSQLFVGVIAPKGTPKDRLNILSTAIKKALQDPELKATLATRKTMINFNNSAEYRKRLEELDTNNKAILKEIGVLK